MKRLPTLSSSLCYDRVIAGSVARWFLGGVITVAFGSLDSLGAENSTATHFNKDIKPILAQYCSDCHADGEKKGGVSFDEFKSDTELVTNHDLWSKVVKNTRARLMPPGNKARPTPEEQKRLETWIKYEAFGLDPKNPDPGRVTVRRLNRNEYRNTIRDLMGIKFNTDVEFPPDDTGYGFDNIGDVLTLSPMLLEKYLTAAKAIVTEAVPVVPKVAPEKILLGNRFSRITTNSAPDARSLTNKDTFLALSYYQPAAATGVFPVELDGSYRLTLELMAKGAFAFDPGRCKVVFKIDDQEELTKEFGWYDGKTFRFDFDKKWPKGDHHLSVELQPLIPAEKRINSLDIRIISVTAHGPLEQQHWVRPKNYERFFTRDAPQNPSQRRIYASEVLEKFAKKAFRRPVDDAEVKRLVKLAEDVYTQPGKTFEAGIAHAMVAVVASPHFLFRLEENEKGSSVKAAFASVNEYALASRLSYFLWSTMPDETLMQLAGRGALRKNLPAQVKRMLSDPRSEQLIRNFTGQWLETRDVDSITINAGAVFARDNGTEKQMRDQQAAFRNQFGRPNTQTNQLASTNALAQLNGLTQTNGVVRTNGVGRGNSPRPQFNFGRGRGAAPPVQLDRDLRDAMQSETELFVASVVREDRSVTELIESDYTFLNEKLAKVYGITNVTGSEMRRVTLPADSPRGGILTHGSVLVVTSNPDRTSPVKRGLFVLDNILGTPPPPPPANIPALEAAEEAFKDHEPTLRETLQLHREKPLCASCHNRLDPIGLAFENFNALGMWREKERNQSIESQGRLVSGESFDSIRELKHILATRHRLDFYRCLTEKMLTYAVGRGIEYYDIEAVDQIVQRLDQENGRFSALLLGVVNSAPFQKQRNQANETSRPQSGGREVTQNQTQP